MGIHTITPAFKGQECINKLQQKNTAQRSTLLPSFLFGSFKLVEGVWPWSINLLPVFKIIHWQSLLQKLHITKTMGRREIFARHKFSALATFNILGPFKQIQLYIVDTCEKTMFVLPTSNYKLKQNRNKIYYHYYKQQEMTWHQECSYLLALLCLTMST